ncbi:polysaccharide deacetylase family protein [Roseibium polysiphoniae]|uniref:Chitooligosaccharide deacetylase n=1 Tax=Roseibium polysiphoniae TaxID=2571221 RepID=A0ABR9C911_9HYPH|nr:polysaccharide deacetylase family protein [Roseibium polysiphoniae]MBD8876019.1 polysaccharide deacetylase family protein [Roseibium polysiphoniae]
MIKSGRTPLFSHVLLYHAVFDTIPDSVKTNLQNVSPDELYKQLAWMKEHFDLVRLDDLLTMPDQEGTFAVTFDDAYKSVFSMALPVLEDLGVPATVFVIGSTLSKKVFWRDKVRLLISAGRVADFVSWADPFCRKSAITADDFYKRSKAPDVNSAELDRLLDDFLDLGLGGLLRSTNLCADDHDQLIDHPLLTYGNHTHNHYVLSSLSRPEKDREIRVNALIIDGLDRKTSKVFSIPFGGLETFDAETFAILAAEGYGAALLSRNRANHQTDGPLPNLYGLPVLERYMPKATFEEFRQQVPDMIRAAHEMPSF